MHGDGATLAAAVPVDVVYARNGESRWYPFIVPKVSCEAVRNGEQPAFLFAASLGLSERN